MIREDINQIVPAVFGSRSAMCVRVFISLSRSVAGKHTTPFFAPPPACPYLLHPSGAALQTVINGRCSVAQVRTLKELSSSSNLSQKSAREANRGNETSTSATRTKRFPLVCQLFRLLHTTPLSLSSFLQFLLPMGGEGNLSKATPKTSP